MGKAARARSREARACRVPAEWFTPRPSRAERSATVLALLDLWETVPDAPHQCNPQLVSGDGTGRCECGRRWRATKGKVGQVPRHAVGRIIGWEAIP